MEIEKKWLVKRENIPYDLSSLKSCEIEQYYLSFDPTVRLRKIDNAGCVLTVKSKVSAVSRNEFEFPVDLSVYDVNFDKICGRVIKKRRYFAPAGGGITYEIDIFSGELEGLCYVEAEFPDEGSCLSFPMPSWALADVTDSPGYSNGDLAKFGMPHIR